MMTREEIISKGPASTVSEHFNIHYGIALGICRAFYRRFPHDRVSSDNWTDQEIQDFNDFIVKELGAKVSK